MMIQHRPMVTLSSMFSGRKPFTQSFLYPTHHLARSLYYINIGVISERDYIAKIALLGRTSKETKVKEIATSGANIITAKANEPVESCMEKMMSKGIRHLPVVDDNQAVIGMISIKDLVKTVLTEKEKAIKTLSDFALGKGGHYGSE